MPDTGRGTVVAVIPAAGHGTRLRRTGGSKEMVELGGRPLIAHLLERVHVARPDVVRVVTRPEKDDLITYLELEGCEVVRAEPPHVGASIAAGIAGLEPESIVVCGFPDTLWEPLDGFLQLVGVVEDGAAVALGLFDVTRAMAKRCDVVALADEGASRSAVTDIDVKPPDPRSHRIWGCLAARARALSGIADAAEPSVHLRSLTRSATLVGLLLSESFSDLGTNAALDEARRTTG